MNSSREVFTFCIIYLFLVFPGRTMAQSGKGELVVNFSHTANGKQIVLRDSTYLNSFGESYQLSRLKYYISNVRFGGTPVVTTGAGVFLVEAGAADSILLQVPGGTFTKIYFNLGVDSILNCSGAQEGALDPLNGMFWTWNSGYIFFKLEGVSPSSAADLNRIEHHIGGYIGPNKAGREIELTLPTPFKVREHERQRVNIRLDMDRYWRSVNDIRIAGAPLLMSPGEQAKRSADNFAAMFSIISFQ